MISLRLAVPAVLAAAIVAGCFTYFVTPPPARVEADQRSPPTVPNLRGPDTTASTSIDQRPSADEKAAAAYWEAAEVSSGMAAPASPPRLGPFHFPNEKPGNNLEPFASAAGRMFEVPQASQAHQKAPLP